MQWYKEPEWIQNGSWTLNDVEPCKRKRIPVECIYSLMISFTALGFIGLMGVWLRG